MAKMKKAKKYLSVGEVVWQQNSCSTLMGVQIGILTLKNYLALSEAEYMHTPQPSSFSCQGCGALGVAQGHLCWKGAWWGSWHAGSLLFLDISVDFMDMFIL